MASPAPDAGLAPFSMPTVYLHEDGWGPTALPAAYEGAFAGWACGRGRGKKPAALKPPPGSHAATRTPATPSPALPPWPYPSHTKPAHSLPLRGATGMPFASFSKVDRLGKAADFGGYTKYSHRRYGRGEENADLTYRYDAEDARE